MNKKRRLYSASIPYGMRRTGGRTGGRVSSTYRKQGGKKRQSEFKLEPGKMYRWYGPDKESYGGREIKNQAKKIKAKVPMKWSDNMKRKKTTTATINKAMKNMGVRHIHRGRPVEHISTAKMTHAMNNPSPIRTGKRGRGSETGAMPSPTNRTNSNVPNIPYTINHSVSNVETLGAQLDKRVMRTNIDTGLPSTRAVMQAAKMNGTVKDTLFDTNIQELNNVQVTRSSLDNSCGFNSRNLWVMPQHACVRLEQIVAEADLEATQRLSTIEQEKIYGSVMYCESQFRFYNQSAHFPIHLKFHVFDYKDEDLTSPISAVFAREAFSSSITTQDLPAMPVRYQHSAPMLEGTAGGTVSTQMKVDYSLKGRGFLDSAGWRERFKVVKTISKKLMPGDTWVVRHRHHCGPGIDIYALLSTLYPDRETTEREGPFSYFYGVESKGVPCEGVTEEFSLDPNPIATYLGTSPGWYQTEFRTSIKYVTASTRAEVDLGNFGVNEQMHIRSFTNNMRAGSTFGITDREFFTLPNDIVNSRDNLAPGKTYVPVITDKFQSDLTTASDRGDRR